MGFHTFDADQAEKLERAASRYRYLSGEELIWALDPTGDDVVADLGSGTGFYTDDVAPHAGHVYAVDVQERMHEFYREKGVPGNVELLTGTVGFLPFETDHLDSAFSTMTYHEFASETAINELSRVVTPGGRVVLADWSATGAGDAGPPIAERFEPAEVAETLEAGGFDVEHKAVRPETFVLVGVRS